MYPWKSTRVRKIVICYSNLWTAMVCFKCVEIFSILKPLQFTFNSRVVGGFFTNPSEKNAQVQLGSSSPNGAENKKYLSCHQLDFQATNHGNKPVLNGEKWLFPTISYVEIWWIILLNPRPRRYMDGKNRDFLKCIFFFSIKAKYRHKWHLKVNKGALTKEVIRGSEADH